MPKQTKQKINYLFFGSQIIPTKRINLQDFEFIDDLKLVQPEDYPRIFTVTKGGLYNHYIPGYDYYYLLRKDIFNQQLKEINDGITSTKI